MGTQSHAAALRPVTHEPQQSIVIDAADRFGSRRWGRARLSWADRSIAEWVVLVVLTCHGTITAETMSDATGGQLATSTLARAASRLVAEGLVVATRARRTEVLRYRLAKGVCPSSSYRHVPMHWFATMRPTTVRVLWAAEYDHEPATDGELPMVNVAKVAGRLPGGRPGARMTPEGVLAALHGIEVEIIRRPVGRPGNSNSHDGRNSNSHDASRASKSSTSSLRSEAKARAEYVPSKPDAADAAMARMSPRRNHTGDTINAHLRERRRVPVPRIVAQALCRECGRAPDAAMYAVIVSPTDPAERERREAMAIAVLRDRGAKSPCAVLLSRIESGQPADRELYDLAQRLFHPTMPEQPAVEFARDGDECRYGEWEVPSGAFATFACPSCGQRERVPFGPGARMRLCRTCWEAEYRQVRMDVIAVGEPQ